MTLTGAPENFSIISQIEPRPQAVLAEGLSWRQARQELAQLREQLDGLAGISVRQGDREVPAARFMRWR